MKYKDTFTFMINALGDNPTNCKTKAMQDHFQEVADALKTVRCDYSVFHTLESQNKEIVFDSYDGEIWKPVEELNGLYEVSNMIRFRNAITKQILKAIIREGYHTINPKIDGKQKNLRLARLVAMAFIPNPDNKPRVDHISTNSLDDRPENLRWVTQSENMNNENTKDNMSGAHVEPVLQYTKNGEFVKEYINATQACKENGWRHPVGLSACCRKVGTAKKFKGFIWKLKKDVPEEKMYAKLDDIDYYNEKNIGKPVIQFNCKGEFVHEWRNIIIATKETGVPNGLIGACCMGKCRYAGGYIWKYKSDVPAEELENVTESMDYHIITRPVNQYTLEGEFIKEWPSAKDAANALGCSKKRISECCKYECKQHSGFIWRYKEIEGMEEKKPRKDKYGSVIQYTLDGKFIKEWPSVVQAAKELGMLAQSIRICCDGKWKTGGGFIWKCKKDVESEKLSK